MNLCTFIGHKWEVEERKTGFIDRTDIWWSSEKVIVELSNCIRCGKERALGITATREQELNLTWAKMVLKEILK